MRKTSKNFGSAIPEIRPFIERYGCRLSDNPPFVLLGQYNSKEIGLVMGVLAAANNEFHAHILRRELRKAGTVDIERTEYHPDSATFSISQYKEKYRQRMAAKKEAE